MEQPKSHATGQCMACLRVTGRWLDLRATPVRWASSARACVQLAHGSCACLCVGGDFFYSYIIKSTASMS